jgi:hypothetical protein
MSILIATALFLAGTTGFIIGMMVAGRHVERECEMAYLTGHVDGFRKAEEEAQ